MMVLGEDCDGKNVVTKCVGNIFFWENPLQVLSGIGGVCSAGVLVVNRLPVVVGVLVVLWWCVPSVLMVFGDVLGVLLMFWWCFCGVFVRWCLGGIEGWYLFD